MFLQSTHNHPRNQVRMDFTRQIALTQGINTDIYQARGEGPLAHLWTAVHFGAMAAYYLAAAYQEDPTPAEAVEMLKQALSDIPMDNEEQTHL
jgi:glucose/mannose-6-phosphate isomerase